MISKERAIELTLRAYRVALRAYPAAHREEFGDLMLQHVRDLCRDGWARRGVLGLAAVWGLLARDAVGSLIAEHASKGRMAMRGFVETLGMKLRQENTVRELARSMLWLSAQFVLVVSVLKLTSLPLTEGQLMIGLLCACAVSLQLTILGVLAVPAKAAPPEGRAEVRS